MTPSLLRSPTALVLSAAALAYAAIGGALALEHIGGYLPCKLCLEQRVPYYVGLWTLAGAAVFAPKRSRRREAIGFAAVTVALFAWGAWLGAFHSGVEWGLWEGPGDCGATNLGSATYDAKDLLEAIMNTRPVSCTEAALRILGLSLAGWNAVVSTAVASLSGCAAWFLYRSK